ncbi:MULTISPECIES: hypothetical protein [Thalassolituus]|uniref:hypothetical protein n=1 Tax=Thalassolituus TaxID=187492 RepID=UPI0030C7ABBD
MGDSAMKSGVDFEIWNHNDRGGLSDTFTGTQGQDNIVGNTDSLETSSKAWVIVFNGTNYTGDSMQVSNSTYLSDLNHVDRYDSSGTKQGDWKNQIQSFVLYNSKPAYWGRNPTSDELFLPSSGHAVFTENTNFLGDNRTFNAPYNALVLHSIGYTTSGTYMYSSVSGAINSLRSGANAWLIVFDDENGGGNALKVNPNTKIKDLNSVSRYDFDGNKKGDWKNQIQSFLLYNHQPEFWSTKYSRPYIDFKTLFDLYPGTTNSSSDDKITYVIEDATYSIDEPKLAVQSTTQSIDNYYISEDFSVLPTDGWTKYNISMDHKNTGGRNDKAEFDLYFDNSGKLVSIQHFSWSSNGAYNISQQLITIVDDEAWLLGTIGAFETLGISEEAADAFVTIFDFLTKVFNDISSLVYKKTDDGGSYYFLPVICHTINRIYSTVASGYNFSTYTSGSDSRNNYTLDFDYTSYSSALSQSSIALVSIGNWAQKSGANGSLPFSQVIEYQYANYKYRTWYPEVSYSAELGMILSCKIDYEIDDDKDDHIILLMGVSVPSSSNGEPVLSFAQATIQFTDMSNENIMSTPCTGSDIISNVYQQLNTGLQSVTADSSTGGRAYLADVAKANLEALMACANFVSK